MPATRFAVPLVFEALMLLSLRIKTNAAVPVPLFPFFVGLTSALAREFWNRRMLRQNRFFKAPEALVGPSCCVGWQSFADKPEGGGGWASPLGPAWQTLFRSGRRELPRAWPRLSQR